MDDDDKKGPVSLAAAVSAPASATPPPPAEPRRRTATRRSRSKRGIVAIGDSDFASNGALGVQGNRDLFLNTINWLAQQENLIAIRPRDPEDRRITLTADQERGSST